MKKPSFSYRLFFTLLLVGGLATFFSANTFSVKKFTDQADMVIPFPVALDLANSPLQVVTLEQLGKIQLPDPETGIQMKPLFLLSDRLFVNGTMEPQSIVGKSITNGNAIHIPTNYSAQVSGQQIDRTTQEITIVYGDGAEEDQLITAIYTAEANQYAPQIQYVKNVLIWKSIFMNGMMLSIILAFFICKYILKKKTKTVQ